MQGSCLHVSHTPCSQAELQADPLGQQLTACIGETKLWSLHHVQQATGMFVGRYVLLTSKLLEHWCGAAGEKNVLRSTDMLISLE